MKKRRGRARNGEGSIRQRKDGYWEVKLTLPSGKRKSYSASSEEAALQKLEEERHKLYQGVPISGERWKVGDFLDTWLQNIKASIRPSTWERYHDFVRLHIKPEVGNIQLSQLSPSHIQALYTKASQKGLAARTVYHLKTVLHTALADAMTKKLIAYNPTEGTRPPKIEPKEMKTFSQEEVNRFFAAMKGDRLEALYVLAIWTGMRQGELLALRWSAVDLDTRELSVVASLRYRHQQFTFQPPKTEKGKRRIKIAPMAVEALRAHKARQADERLKLGQHWQGAEKREDDLVFTNHVGGPMDASNLLKYCFYPALKKAGLPRIRFHDLRHTFATLQLKAKTPAKTVSTMLGHSTIAITLDTYTHDDLEEQDEALAAMERNLFSKKPG
jgi:integrase